MDLDFEWCYRAVDSRDRRFDGWFFTAVTSTGVYCRPSCPARTPHRRNVRFFPSAAAAQEAGFRACRRCQPDAVPGSPRWDTRADLAGRAMRLTGDGVVDRDGVPGLARRLGYTERHLHRMLTAEVGAGPLARTWSQRRRYLPRVVPNLPLAVHHRVMAQDNAYDWVDDESLDLSATMARLDQLEPAVVVTHPHWLVAELPATSASGPALLSEQTFGGQRYEAAALT